MENSRKVVIRPAFIHSLEHASASHRFPAGEVRSTWHREGDRIRLEVACPAGVACETWLEDGYVFAEDGNSYREDGRGSYWIRKISS